MFCQPPHFSRHYLEEWEKRVDTLREQYAMTASARSRPAATTTQVPPVDNQAPSPDLTTPQSRASMKRKRQDKSDYHIPAASADDTEDYIEPHMTVPKSALDACGESFIAADGDRVKASKTFFDDTGLMALLCRHDRPLFIASMWTAGEKQFYALALIDALLSHLPPTWNVGLLYDISCQLHRTLSRWDEDLHWLHRVEFAVSVFHAYGHQWSCQLWYHPRKSTVWGLSDGEGCERFWSELRKLIPCLRVAGVSAPCTIISCKNVDVTCPVSPPPTDITQTNSAH